ncbi:alpha-amylase family glycosyl hydrolase [Hymenobacter sp. BT770]|uniref:alpha-amylase family glycosyl hydrolase n=1 Tax=Hymenobacter sp. BT770 TaxID=2886942 RepID=UPI001D12C908|nr:alpha-amylase family glycosyl hydrolase [Hymenobacter sp. BT770]MCC3152750.1 alpha-amylase [Hymenobacter sp. BT770]MDO3414823.1 alpha-amylase family glycosyl hydrolase [Hymenobacter sp. BT770]
MTHASFSRLLWALLPLLGLGSCHSGTNSATEKQVPAAGTPDASAYTIKHPDWAKSASIYQVNVRQYTPEGTFRAFEAHLPRLQKMGVGILWLMPIHPIGVSHRKGTLGSAYSVRDYRAVNPDLGTLADLQHLVNEAHKRGLHVILDWVANHTSWDNALTTEHPDWYTRDSLGHFRPPVADWQDVIDLDYSKPALRRYMTESMAYWVKTAGIDGFRADVAGLVPTDFWNDTRQELEKTKPVFMLAEWDELFPPTFLKRSEFEPNTRLLEKAFDATYALRLHGLLDSLGRGQKPTSELAHYLAAERKRYPAGVNLMTFTSTHDINAWDGSEYERLGANALPEAVLTALMPGIPMVYSGQEAALKKRLRFFDKDTIPWNGFPLQGFYTTLLQLKMQSPALRNYDATGRFRLLPAPAECIAFLRSNADSTARVVVAINLGAKPQQVALPAPAAAYADAFAPAKAAQVPAAPLTVPAHGYRVLVSK